MQVRKTSIFVLSLLLSYEAFGANASIRAGALRLNQPQNSVSNTANKTTSEKLSINDTLSSYNRASSLRPNRVQVSGGGNKNPAVNEEVLNKVYEEMERVTSAVEQELYLTSREIKNLKDEIAEKDEKIKDLELALEDYEEMKETVKNIPNVYYSKREVDSKGYVMPSTLSSAIETAKNTVKKEALAEVNSKGFITSSAVADEIAQAKNAAVSAAVAQVENMNFATANSVAAAETRMANAIDSAKATITNERNAALQLYAKTSDVASEITLAKNTAIADAKTQTIAAIEDKNYATQQFVNTELSNLDLGIDEAAVGTIIENKLLAKDYATKSFAENKASAALNEAKSYTNTSVNNETTSRQAAINTIDSRLSTYATRTEVDNMVEEAVKPESIATGLLNNNQFKTELVSAVNQDVSALSTRVGALEAEDTTINNRLATFSTKQELSGAVADINNTIDNLELGIDENVVIGIIDDQIGKKKVLTESSNVFTAVKNTVDAIPDNYYSMSKVDQKIAEAAAGGEIDLSGYLAKDELNSELKKISDTEICLTKNCVSGQVEDGISGLEFGVDEDTVVGIIENKLPTITAFKAVKNTVDAIPDNYYSMSKVDQKIAEAAAGGEIDLSGYLAKDELNSELKKISDTEICLTKNCVSGQVEDGISGLEFGVDEDTVVGIIENKLPTITAFKAVKNTVDAIPDNYYSMSSVDQKIADAVTGGEIDLSGYLAKDELIGELKKISDTEICLTKNCAADFLENKGLLVDGKRPDFLEAESQEIVDIKEKVQLIPEYGMQCLSLECVNDRIEQNFIDKKVVKQDTLLSDIEGLNKFVKADDVNAMVTEAVNPDNIATNLLQNDKFKKDLTEAVNQDVSALSTRVDALEAEDTEINNKFALYTDTGTMNKAIADAVAVETKARTDAGYLTNNSLTSYATKSFVSEEITKEATARNSAISGLSSTYATKTELNGVDDKFDSYYTKTQTDDAINGAVTKEKLKDTLSGEYLASGSLSNYATKSFVGDEIAKETTARNSAISGLSNTYATKSALDSYVLKSKLQDDIEGLNTFVTVGTVEDIVTEKVDPDNIATNLLQNDKFKEDLTEAVNQDVSALSTRVGALETKDQEINNKFKDYTPTAELGNTYATKSALSTVDNKFAQYTDTGTMNKAIADAVAVETKARTDAGYLTNSALSSYATKSFVGEEITKETTARNSAISGLSSTYATKTELNGVNSKFASYYTKTETDDEIDGAVTKDKLTATLGNAYLTDATLTQGMLKTKLGDAYLTDDSLNGYATTDAMNSAINAAKSAAITDAVAQAKTARDTALASYAKTSDITKAKLTATLGDAYLTDASLNGYATTDAMNSAINAAKSAAITDAVAQAKTARDTALASYAKTSDITKAKLTATLGDAYLTDASLNGYATTDAMNSAINAAKSAAITDAVAQAKTARDTALASYAKTSDITKAKLTATLGDAYLTDATLTQGMLTTRLGDAYVTSGVMTDAIATAKSAAITAAVSQANTARDTALASYAKTSDMTDAIATAKSAAITAAVSQAATDRSAALDDYVSKEGLGSTVSDAIASNKTITDMAADIQKNATAAAEASATASAAQTAANTASATANAAQSAADKASATADTASETATAVNAKIGDLSGVVTGKDATVADAIAGVKSTAETASAAASAAGRTAAEAQETATGAATAVQTLESKALTVDNYCTNKPTECTGGGIGTEGKQ